MTELKLCKDCKFFVEYPQSNIALTGFLEGLHFELGIAVCLKQKDKVESNTTVDPVDGQKVYNDLWRLNARIQRTVLSYPDVESMLESGQKPQDICGANGEFWERVEL